MRGDGLPHDRRHEVRQGVTFQAVTSAFLVHFLANRMTWNAELARRLQRQLTERGLMPARAAGIEPAVLYAWLPSAQRPCPPPCGPERVRRDHGELAARHPAARRADVRR